MANSVDPEQTAPVLGLYFLRFVATIKIVRIRTPEKVAVNIVKCEQCGFTVE